MKGAKPPLSRSEQRLLEAIAERIFPATDTPGAVEIGAPAYIEIALAGAYATLAPLYRSGLRAVDRHSRTKFKGPFRTLSARQQDAVLKDFESSAVPKFKRAADFFETLRCHVLEGVFCEPQYGGNKAMAGWRLVGFPGQQFGYADPYVNKRVDLEPVAVSDSTTESE